MTIWLFLQFWRQSAHRRDGMSAFQGGNDSFDFGEKTDRSIASSIGRRSELHPAAIAQIAQLGADTGIVQARRYGVGFSHLALPSCNR